MKDEGREATQGLSRVKSVFELEVYRQAYAVSLRVHESGHLLEVYRGIGRMLAEMAKRS